MKNRRKFLKKIIGIMWSVELGERFWFKKSAVKEVPFIFHFPLVIWCWVTTPTSSRIVTTAIRPGCGAAGVAKNGRDNWNVKTVRRGWNNADVGRIKAIIAAPRDGHPRRIRLPGRSVSPGMSTFNIRGTATRWTCARITSSTTAGCPTATHSARRITITFSGKPIDFEQMLRNAGVRSRHPIKDIFL